MWTTRIALKPLFTIRNSIDLAVEAQKLAKKYDNKGKWDAVLSLSEMEPFFDELECIRNSLLNENIHTGKLNKHREPTILAAVDASTKIGRGIVFFDSHGVPFQIHFIIPNHDEKKKCAFYCEVLVILEALQRANIKGVTVRLVSDCVPAIVCVLKGYSRNKEACDLIKMIYELLWSHDSSLELRWVAGKMQVADDVSRAMGINDDKLKESLKALKEELNLPPPKGRFNRGGKDHEFEDNDEEDVKNK